MASSTFYGTGRRKSSIARVYLTPGTGKITINKKDIDDYFGLETLKIIARQPFEATNTADKYDAKITVKGGGFTGQDRLVPSVMVSPAHLTKLTLISDQLLRKPDTLPVIPE